MKPLRTGNLPMLARYGQVVGLALIWKWFYYAPNTMKEMYARREREATKAGEDFENPFKTGELPSTLVTVVGGAFKGQFGALIETIKCFAPYAAFQFAALPALGYAVGGAQMATGVLLTSILADVITNVHSFIIIATNHVGDDIYRFESETKPRSDDFYLRAVIGSANFRTGGDVNDFFHGWLNYQIEHHMFADMSMLSYQRMAPEMKALCEKYGVPYVQENVFVRLKKTVDVMIGAASFTDFKGKGFTDFKGPLIKQMIFMYRKDVDFIEESGILTARAIPVYHRIVSCMCRYRIMACMHRCI